MCSAGPQEVLTPREVYEALSMEGFKVEYHRVPITDGSLPREHLFDLFYHTVERAGPQDPIIFNCQMGAGRTTTGMVIACLVRTHLHGGSQPGTQEGRLPPLPPMRAEPQACPQALANPRRKSCWQLSNCRQSQLTAALQGAPCLEK